MHFTDQLGRRVHVDFPPCRIISLVPSQTELLFDLGLDEEVVGLTKFCVHPQDKFRTRPRVGGTKQVNLQKVQSLNPDLIIGNKEENDEQQIRELMKKFPVWISDIGTLPEALAMIRDVGSLVDKPRQALELSQKIDTAFLDLAKSVPAIRRRVAYFIWRQPYMVAAGKTFINEMLQAAGFINVFGHLERYPEINLTDLNKFSPDLILLSSEPYPFRKKHYSEFSEGSRKASVKLVDGELFSWYGSRLLKAPAYFLQI